jgi:hypothetical protein
MGFPVEIMRSLKRSFIPDLLSFAQYLALYQLGGWIGRDKWPVLASLNFPRMKKAFGALLVTILSPLARP